MFLFRLPDLYIFKLIAYRLISCSSCKIQIPKSIIKMVIIIQHISEMSKVCRSLLNTKLSHLHPDPETLRSFKIFMVTSKQEIHQIVIQSINLTVQEIIECAITQFSLNFNERLNQNVNTYQLYVAKKNGSKNNDYPSLEMHQQITKFGFNRFYLEDKHHQSIKKSQIPFLSTEKSLEDIQIDFDKKISHHQEVVEKQRPYCGCFWKK